jgi:hypothetical protein
MAKKENPKNKNSVEKRKTIIVTDPKDKRLRAYTDSLKTLDIPFNYYDKFGDSMSGATKRLPTVQEKQRFSYKGIAPIEIINYEHSGRLAPSKYKEPVQPYVYKKPNNIVKTKPAYKLEKKKPVVKTPVKPVAKTVAKTVVKAEIKPTQKPVVKEEKTLYQGRNFMDSTGLRPNLYTKSEVANAARLIKEKKAKDKK